MKLRITNYELRISDLITKKTFSIKTTDHPPFAVHQKAFTLIEVLLVIVMIGVIVAMAAPDYLRFRQKIDLKNSANLLQTGLQEAASLARSRSIHYLVEGGSGADFYHLKVCDNYDCLASTIVPDAQGQVDQRELEGRTTLKSPNFKVMFTAPHGDVVILDPSSPLITPLPITELTVTLDNQGLERSLHLYARSGLVTLDTP